MTATAATALPVDPTTATAPSYALRPITAADDLVLRRIFASTRTAEMARVPWNETQKAQFLGMQFNAQHQHYQRHFGTARFDLIEVGHEVAGRLYVDRVPGLLHIIDIALLPAFRGAGLGDRILRELQEEAAGADQAVDIFLEKTNPARSLYARLGFAVIETGDIYDRMQWKVTAYAAA